MRGKPVLLLEIGIVVFAGTSTILKLIAGERVVTDPKTIQSPNGIPIDFGYNETLSAEKKKNMSEVIFQSAPGCPSSVNGLPWLYYGDPANCFLVGTSGPCRPGQLLFGNMSSHYAHCDCLCSPKNTNINRRDDTYDVHIREQANFRFCSVKNIPEMNESVFDRLMDTCFFMETMGPCQKGEWLVKDRMFSGNSTTCVPQCSSDTGPFQSLWFYDWRAGKCELKTSLSISMPVSLAQDLPQNECEEGKIYSKLLQKCIPKSKAFFMGFK